ncbi:hypothetical protein AMTRI_Chr12g268960 [Amborella trichopoda]|uniref:Bifunctional inhibitor/plant lipid transfer protein/seed storage helical domain-containing protein n=1 Tax=Amborella trichopoda TaxID=13333 RepID=U5D4W0_AMBTC|nr:non-specific lipid-transfer protein 2 [Amborella trichopoda]ERN17260.1 hypothetical protein AMTR_s00044p00214770 [Amborella trichopoda]|eukprot:XP_006855793.1 non-specific lipid-transfer protein 2 [Amborella trichopoda]
MMKCSSFSVLILALVVLVGNFLPCYSVTCNVSYLSPCIGAIYKAQAPSPTCCSRLKEQQPCLCQYIANPQFRSIVNSDNAKKVAQTCKSPFPKC